MGTITAVISGGSFRISWPILGLNVKKTSLTTDTPGMEFIQVEILGNIYEFELRENEMFYFFINQEDEAEIYVDRNW